MRELKIIPQGITECIAHQTEVIIHAVCLQEDLSPCHLQIHKSWLDQYHTTAVFTAKGEGFKELLNGLLIFTHIHQIGSQYAFSVDLSVQTYIWRPSVPKKGVIVGIYLIIEVVNGF